MAHIFDDSDELANKLRQMNNNAREARSNGDFAACHALIDQMIEESRINNRPDLLANSLNARAAAYNVSNEHKAALEVALEATSLSAPYPRIQSQSLLLYGVAQHYTGNNTGAIDSMKKSIELAQQENDKDLLANCYHWIGIAYQSEYQYDRALESFFRALEFYRENDVRSLMSRLLNSIGLVFRDLEDLHQALSFLNQARDMQEGCNDRDTMADILNNLGMLQMELGNFRMSIDYYQKALDIRTVIKGDRKLSHILNNIGNAWGALYEMNKAVQYHQQALTLREKINDPRLMASSLANLAQVLINTGDSGGAAEYLERALALAEGAQAQDIATSVYRVLGQMHEQNRNYRVALFWYKRFMESSTKQIRQKGQPRIAAVLSSYLTAEKDRETTTLRIKNEELQQSYEQLTKAQNEIIKLEKKNAVLAVVVTANHELNQPLTTATGNLDLLRTILTGKQLPPAVDNCMDRMTESMERMAATLEKLRNVADICEIDYQLGVKMLNLETIGTND